MNGRNIFIATSSQHLHHIFTKPCVSLLRKSIAYEWSNYFSTDLRNILRKSLAYEWSNYFSTDFQQTCEISFTKPCEIYLVHEWSKYFSTDLRNILRRSLAKYIWRMNGRNNFITRLENEWSKHLYHQT